MRPLSFRAVWVVTVSPDISCKVTFSRRFPTVEQQWRQRCKQVKGTHTVGVALTTPLPFDLDLGSAFSEHLTRSSNGHDCLRGPGSSPGHNQWVDDPITRHVIALRLPSHATPAKRWEHVASSRGRQPAQSERSLHLAQNGRQSAAPQEQASQEQWLWPVVVHQHSRMPQHFLLLLPRVEPEDVLDYARLMHSQQDCCANPAAHGEQLRSLSQLLRAIPAITCAFHVAQCMEPLIAHDLGAGTGTASGTMTPPGAAGGTTAASGTGATTPPLGVSPTPLSLLDTLSASMGLLGVAGARPGASTSSTMVGGGVTSLAGGASNAGAGLGLGSSVPVVDRGGLVGLERLRSQLKAVAETSGTGPAAAAAAPAGADKGKPTPAAGPFSLRDADVDGLQFLFATFLPFGYPLDFPSPPLIAAMRAQAVPQDLSTLLGPTGAATTSSTPHGTPEKPKATSWLSLTSTAAAAGSPAFPAAELKQGPTTAAAWGSQPAWKPILYSGKQRISVSVVETVRAALYDRSDVPDTVQLSGRVACRFDLDGLPEVTLNLELPAALTQSEAWITLHPCVQVQMVTGDTAQFLVKLRLMEGLRGAVCHMDFCVLAISVPPGQRLISVEGQPSLGTVSHSERVLRWQVLARGYSGAPLDVTFAGTLHLEQDEPNNQSPSPAPFEAPLHDAAGPHDQHASTGIGDAGAWSTDHERPMGDLRFDVRPEMAWGDALCWTRYSYAKVNFRLHGSTLSGLALSTKDVSIVPAPPKGVPITVDHQVLCAEYVLWNTLGDAPTPALASQAG